MAQTAGVDRDYVLGTCDQETLRLGIQHAAWQPIARACWEHAGIGAGHHVIDVGAGPGFAAFDLAEIVGPEGRVTAVERSARFIDAGRSMSRGRGVVNVEFVEADLMTQPLPGGNYDAAWCRWVASFVESTPVLVDHVASAVRPGGVAVFHEYADYGSWRYFPTALLLEEYVARVMDSWRRAGGEPDAGLAIPHLLAQRGYRVESVQPRVYCVRPGEPLWEWIATFVESNVGRLVELKECDEEWADRVRSELRRVQADSNSVMITPLVLEVIARRPKEDRHRLEGEAL